MTLLRLYPGDRVAGLAALTLVQVALVVLLARLAARAVARRDAAARHGIWLCALACVLLAPALVLGVDRAGLTLAAVPVPALAARPAPSGPAHRPPGREGSAVPAAAEASARPPEPGPRLAAAPVPPEPRSASWADRARAAGGLALAIWAAGSLVLLVRLALGLVATATTVREGRPVSDPELRDMVVEVAAALGAAGPFRVATTARLEGPVAAGIARPVVLLPEDLPAALGRAQLRDVLMHEGAHLVRRDPLIGLLQRLAEALFWAHPAVHRLNRELTRAREEVCDNFVLRGGDRRRYARTLVDLAESLGSAPCASPAPGLFRGRWGLAERVAGLLDERRMLMTRADRRLLVAPAGALLAVALAVAGLRPLAASPAPRGDDKPAAKPDAPAALAEDEIAGTVVDAEGRPIDGVLVDVWDWYPGNETRTDKQGRFRLSVAARDAKGNKLPGGFEPKENLEVRFLKEGYSPVLSLDHKPGTAGWEVVLKSDTYFEGRVLDPDGRPVADALLRADQGPKSANPGYVITQIWTEARSGADGRYRLYLSPDGYDIQVRVPGRGVARRKESIAAGEARPLDIRLERGIAFVAKVVDAATGAPVAGVRLWNWQHKGVEGRSDADGTVTVADMFPGRFQFQVEAPGFGRWWSEQAATEWSRRQVEPNGWQRNFDSLDFDLEPGMRPVTIALERAVTVRGRVLDPDGTPVAGATVAPALTGTGNSITGDTRYSVETGKDGRFELILPASNDRDYNLIAHDGKFMVWRRWANGVGDPIRTRPGQVLDDVTLRLNRPAVVRGRVVDALGAPVARREVRATGVDKRDNRYYVPTVETDAKGRFELKFVGPGEQFIQAAPFWLDPAQAPIGSSAVVTLRPGDVKDDVELTARPEGR